MADVCRATVYTGQQASVHSIILPVGISCNVNSILDELRIVSSKVRTISLIEGILKMSSSSLVDVNVIPPLKPWYVIDEFMVAAADLD